MNDNTNKIFSIDTENFNLHYSEDNSLSNPPQLESPILFNEFYYISSQDLSQNHPKLVDHRIKESIMSAIEDIEELEPKYFGALLNETHSILVKTFKEVTIPEIKDSLHSLISLIEENTEQLIFFQNNICWLQKA